MITGSTASAQPRTPPSGAALVPGVATPGRRAEQVTGGTAQAPAVDRITLTPAARLDLLMTGAEARLHEMDVLLRATSGSVSDPSAMDMHDVARLVQAARGAATAVETASDANVIAVGRGLPGQAERVVALVAHASSSLQAATVRLIQTQATADGAVTGDRVPPLHNRDHASTGETTRSVADAGCEPASLIAADLPNSLMIATALAAEQEIAMRLERLRTASPASGALLALRLSRQKEDSIRAGNGMVRRPVLPGVVCVLVALVLFQRIDPGPVQHIATVLVLPMVLAWCGHWLVRRRQNDWRLKMAWWQDELVSEPLDASMSTTDAPGAGHANRAAPLT